MILEKIIAEHGKHPENPYMFPSPVTGEMYYPDSVVNLHKKILKDAGLPHIRFHDLRHTFATLALQNGVDVKTVSSMLGHYDAGFTLRTYIAMLIAVDHGNKQIKTVHTPPFTSGLIQSDTPGFGTDALAYRGKYYTLTDQRIPYRRDKTEDERFFILTLFAIAHEIEAMGQYSGSLMRVQLAVGLPPAHFGVQAKRFINYFNGRGAVAFQFKGKPYAIFIENTACFPQSFSAAAATVKNLASFPRALVVDIGGFTADYVRLRNGVPDMAACDSLENGVILLYNRICAKANAELDILLEESEIDRILRGEDQDAAPEVIALAEREAQEFINDLLSGLRERMLELKSGKVIFLGGGATLLRRQIEASGKIGQAIFVEDINANAKGYEYLYRLQHSGR